VARGRLGFWQRFAAFIVKPMMTVWTRRTWRGAEHVPKTGPVIIVANHLSHADPLVAAHFVYDADRWPQFLAKASLFSVPVLGALLKRVRQIPVFRNSADAGKALEAAVAAVGAGDLVIIYPEGTTTREPDLWPMRGRTGVARLALMTGAPVVPMVMWGPQQIFDPRTHRFSIRPRRAVTVVAGPPLDLSRWTAAPPTAATLNELTEMIMLCLRDMLAEIRGEAAPPLWSPTRAGTNEEAR
jgi:1-acyl-sn-glycerol-3-phosphate acyltransferase